jgi:hypothetical protein
MDFTHEATIAADAASQTYVGRWNHLVSNTNWQKGRIIHEWRAARMASGAAASEYADETWSRLVGGVSGQHVGRLRRVYERFGDVQSQYDGLYWSHFQASLDWDDAEMWLEGAVQSGWSVAEMRRQRYDTLGALAAGESPDDKVVTAEVDEDFVDDSGTASTTDRDAGELVADDHAAEIRSPAGPDFGDEDDVPPRRGQADDADEQSVVARRTSTGEPVRPFADLAELPDDVAEAFEAFQLAILRHKAEGWQAISLADLLASLDALKALALAEA